MNVEQHWTLGPLGPLGPSGGAPVDTGEVSANITRKGYTLGRTLGAGRFSQVLHGKHASGAEFAVKVIEQDEDVESLEALRVEVAVLKATDHPNIVRLHEVVRTPSSTYLVMELLRGGELFDTIVEKGCFTEPEAKRVLRQLLSAVAHCHALGIVHRDLKPENLLFSQTAEAEGQEGEAQLKIIDFGYAALLEPGQQLRGLSGAASQTRRLRLRRSRPRPCPSRGSYSIEVHTFLPPPSPSRHTRLRGTRGALMVRWGFGGRRVRGIGRHVVGGRGGLYTPLRLPTLLRGGGGAAAADRKERPL